MRILPRYLYRLYLPVFLLCVGVCTAVLLMNHFIRLFNLAVMKGISLLWILSCFSRLLPYFFSLAVPIAFLVALLLTLGSLSESGEVLALRSSGFSFRDILRPYFHLALALCLLLLYVNHKASPEGYHSFKKSYENALSQISQLDLEPDTLTQIGEWKLYARQADSKSGELSGVYLVKLKGDREGLRVEAPEGTMRLESGKGFRLTLRRGMLRLPDIKPLQQAAVMRPSKLLSAAFSEYSLWVPLAGRKVQDRPLDIQEMNTFLLRERVRDPLTDASHRKEYLTEMALRTAGALTPFVFFWMACPLGLRLEKHAKATGFILSLLLLFLYYGLMVVGIGLGRRHLALSSLGPWLPVAAGLAAGAYFWRKNLRV